MSYGKLRSREVFRATVNGTDYTFTCYTQHCGTHIRELCCLGFSDTTEPKYIKGDIIGKDIWYNRPWYSFRYEKALRNGIDNLDITEDEKEKLKAILIDKTIQEEEEESEKSIEQFKNLYDQTSSTFKEKIANSGIIMQSDDDVRAVKGLMLLDILMNK